MALRIIQAYAACSIRIENGSIRLYSKVLACSMLLVVVLDGIMSALQGFARVKRYGRIPMCASPRTV